MSKKKKIIITIIIVVILLVGGTLLYPLTRGDNNKNTITSNGFIEMDKLENAKVKNNKKYNISKEVKKEHNYEKYSFDNMKIYSNEGTSALEFTITNISNDAKAESYTVFIDFKDKNGDLIYSLNYVIPDLKVGKTKKEKITEIPLDIINAYDYVVQGF